METARYRVSAHSFITNPQPNGIIVYQLSTDDLFYAKVNIGGVVSVVLLGSGASLTGYLYNNIDVEQFQNHTNNATTLAAVQLTGDGAVTELHYPNLESALLYISQNISLLVIDFPALISTAGIVIAENPVLPNIILDALETASNDIYIAENRSILSVEFASLTAITGKLTIDSNALLAAVDIDVLESATEVIIFDNPSLVNITISATDANYTEVDFRNNALSLASETGILTSLVASNESNGTLKLEGGTNDALDLAAQALKATLVGRGWTVTNN